MYADMGKTWYYALMLCHVLFHEKVCYLSLTENWDICHWRKIKFRNDTKSETGFEKVSEYEEEKIICFVGSYWTFPPI